MSVINQMLKDLDNRTTKSIQQGEVRHLFHSSRYRSTRKKWLAISVFSAAGLLFAADLYVVSQHWRLSHHVKSDSNAKIQLKQFVQEAQPILTAPSSFTQAPVILTGLTMQTQNNTTFLRLLFSATTLYRIGINEKSDALIATFDHAHLITSLPTINYTDSAIQHIGIENHSNDQLVISIYPKQNVHLQQAQFDPINANTFQLNFSNTQTTSVSKLKPQPLNVNEIYQQALQLWQNRNEVEAENYLRQALRENPDALPLVLLEARIRVDKNQIKTALHLLEKHAPSINIHPEYYAFLAALYQRSNQAHMAASLYQQLIELQPHNGIWWIGLGISLNAVGRQADALQAFHRAEQEDGLTPTLKAYVEEQIHAV